MRNLIAVAAIAAASVTMSGCMGLKLTPEQTHVLMTDFGNAGCGGTVDLKTGAAAGQLGGEGHISLEMHGQCPVRTPVPLSVGGVLPSAAPPT